MEGLRGKRVERERIRVHDGKIKSETVNVHRYLLASK